MRFIYAEYNMYHNSIDVTTFDGYILRIDCNKAEEGLRTTPCSQCALDALAIKSIDTNASDMLIFLIVIINGLSCFFAFTKFITAITILGNVYVAIVIIAIVP